MDFPTRLLYGNTVSAWLIFVGLALVGFVVLKFFVLGAIRRIARAASHTANHWDDVIAAAVGSTRSVVLLLLAVFIASTTLVLHDAIQSALRSITVIAFLVQGGLWLDAGLSTWLKKRAEERAQDEPAEVMTMNVIGIATKLVLWSMVLLLALENLGVDVTALVAGLGVGGVAVALAAQNILGDLFASLSIVLDKPFVLGDFLVVGDFLGRVEAIGLKTTRVRSLSGEQVVFANADLLGSRIRNYGRMFERRVVLKVGVTYQTPRDALAWIPTLIRESIEAHGDDTVRFDRAHMSGYGDYAILFEAVYYVLSADYNAHMDVQQDILLRLHEGFERRDVEFAYPTHTIFLDGSESSIPALQSST